MNEKMCNSTLNAERKINQDFGIRVADRAAAIFAQWARGGVTCPTLLFKLAAQRALFDNNAALWNALYESPYVAKQLAVAVSARVGNGGDNANL